MTVSSDIRESPWYFIKSWSYSKAVLRDGDINFVLIPFFKIISY